MQSITKVNETKEAKIEELKNKISSKKRKPKKSDTKTIKNIEKRKN